LDTVVASSSREAATGAAFPACANRVFPGTLDLTRLQPVFPLRKPWHGRESAAKDFPVPAAPEYPVANRLREMAVAERPQERLEKLGAGALSDAELLAMLLRSGTHGHDVLTLATRLVGEAGSLAGLIAWQPRDYRKMNGIGRVKALQLIAVMEVARRVIGQQAGDSPLMNRADLVSAYFQPIVSGLQVEKFWVLCLNRKNRLVKRVEITSGTATAALAHPREVFRAAIQQAASAVVCVHNHPSGDPAPSAPDVHVTRQLRDAAKAVEIELLDHVIIGRAAADPSGRGFFSFRDAGIL
jgi:DNA repair protein RadC